MGKAVRNYLIILGVLVVVMGMTVFSTKGKVNWEPTYKVLDKSPYGLYILNQEIDHFFNQKVKKISYTPYEYLKRREQAQVQNYIFTNDIDETSLNRVLSKVAQGSEALFIMKSYSPLLDTLNIGITNAYLYDNLFVELTTSSFNDKVSLFLEDTHNYYTETQYRYTETHYFTKLKENRDNALGYVYFRGDEDKEKKEINFAEVPFGKGKIYIYLTPIVFTNYYLKDYSQVRKLASVVISYLPKGNETVWFDRSFSGVERSDILSFVMGQPPLRIAWQLMLLALLLYLLFKGKRMQRIIPVIEKPQNTTIEFAQSISTLYYQDGNPTDLVQKKITYFLDQLRQRYYLDTQQINQNFAQRLHNKSGKDKELIDKIVGRIIQFETTKQADEKTLTALDKEIEEFWYHS